MKLTKLELKVITLISEHCYDEYSSSVKDLAKDLVLKVNTVKGIIGSLTKKGLISCEEEIEWNGEVSYQVFILVNEEAISYGCDCALFSSSTDLLKSVIKDIES